MCYMHSYVLHAFISVTCIHTCYMHSHVLHALIRYMHSYVLHAFLGSSVSYLASH